MNETNGKRETLRLEVDVPVVAELLFDTPLPVQGKWGDQFMYTLRTGDVEKVFYADPALSAEFEKAGVRKGEPFKIGKMSRRDGNRRGVEWKIRKLDPEEAAPPSPGSVNGTAHQAPGETAKPQHQDVANPTTQAPLPETRPQTQLEDALKTVVAACHAAGEYAKQINFQMPPFTSDDISRMAMTLAINGRQNGGRP